MGITIHYCGRGNYLPRATSLAARIKEETGAEAELIRGGSGIFDVHQDDKLIFSKHEAGRFPEEDEILSQLEG